MKGVSLCIELKQKNPAVLVGRPGLNKREGSYGKFKAD
jgi:hypothetical protein